MTHSATPTTLPPRKARTALAIGWLLASPTVGDTHLGERLGIARGSIWRIARRTGLRERVTSPSRPSAPPLSARGPDRSALTRRIARLERDAGRYRKAEEWRARQLAAKLAWVGFSTDEAVLAMTDGVLVGPDDAVPMTPTESRLFREVWSEWEDRVTTHYVMEWHRQSGVPVSITTMFAEREAWVAEQMEQCRWPYNGPSPRVAGES